MAKILLFYTGEDAFNFYADRLAEEFINKGNNVFILDTNVDNAKPGHTLSEFESFRNNGIDMAICYNGLGIMTINSTDNTFVYNNVIDLTDREDTCLVNILMNPAYRFHGHFLAEPKQCINYLYDRNDVKYMIKVFQKTHTGFMPHAATPAKESAVPYEERKYSLLLTDDYEDPDISFKQLSTVFAEDTPLYHAFRESYELMKEKSKLTVIEAFDEILDKYDIILSLIDKIMLYQNSMYTEIAIQNYFRGKVVETVADSGLDIWIAGRGWENHPSFGKPNVHILSDVHNYADRLKCMADAKINLNVMPWTKDGSSEKIFNSLLRDALPLTDPTKWLLHNLVPEKETAYFNLNELEKIPKIVKHYLASPDEAKTVIEAGKKKVEDKWTWEHVADRILGLRS